MDKLIDKIVSDDEIAEKINSETNNRKKKIIETIWKVVNTKKDKYGKYFKLLEISWGEIKPINLIIKEELFQTNLLFNVKFNRWITNICDVYIKFYNPISYSHKIKSRINSLIQRANNNTLQTRYILKSRIATKNRLMAECYVRNYNMVIYSSNLRIGYSSYDSGFKYYVYVIISQIQ